MKMKNVAPIPVLGLLMLFAMCKKDKDSMATNTGNGTGSGTGSGTDANSNRSQLISFSPDTAAIGDTITIIGKNFTGTTNNLTVSFGSTTTSIVDVKTATINNVVNTTIRALVPQMTESSVKINVKIDTLLLTSNKNFNRISVTQFSGFSPTNGYIGDTITLTGKFGDVTPTVNFGNASAKIVSKDATTLKVLVPDAIADATTTISMSILGQTLTNATSFHLNAPVIDSISPGTGFLGGPMLIYGKGFSNATKNTIYWDNSSFQTTYASYNNVISFTPKNGGVGMHTIAIGVAGLKTANISYNLIAPVITSISPDSVTEDDVLVIKGQHFLDPNNTSATAITINNTSWIFPVQPVSDNEIHITMPDLTSGNYTITVTVHQSSVTSSTSFAYYVKPI